MSVTVPTVEIEVSHSWTQFMVTSAPNLPEICVPSNTIHLYEGDT